MPYTKEQLREYWQTNKATLNQKRRQKRRLAKSAMKEVSHLAGQVSPTELKRVSHGEVSHLLQAANLNQVSHNQSNLEMANPTLTRLIKEWQTSTNYNCAPNCQTNYCSNCWYFAQDKLVDYKGGSM